MSFKNYKKINTNNVGTSGLKRLTAELLFQKGSFPQDQTRYRAGIFKVSRKTV